MTSLVRQDGSCPVGVDNSFGPWAGPDCRGGFDFTLLFEEAILSVPVQAFLLVLLPVRIWQLVGEDRKVVLNWQLPSKLLAAMSLAALNAAVLGLWSSAGSDLATRATIATSSLSFVASCGFCLLSYLEHERAVRPSFLITIFLSSSVLLDLARCRTLFMLGLNDGRGSSAAVIPGLFAAAVALRAVMFVLESYEKRSILVEGYRRLSKEVTSSTLSRATFWWMVSMLRTGYQRILILDDLTPLEARMQSEKLLHSLSAGWEKVPDKLVASTLFVKWHAVFIRPVLAGVIPKLFMIALSYAQPFLVTEAILLAARPRGQPQDNYGYGLIGAYAIVFTGQAIAMGQYERYSCRAATIMRGSISALIYEKALRLDISAPDVSPSGALTLIGTDCETVMSGMMLFHNFWGGVLEIIVGIYLLYRQLGAACAMPLSVTFVVLIAIAFLGVSIGGAQANWIQASQDRVTATSKTLGSIKWLKISGLNDTAFSMLQKLRSNELKVSMKFRALIAVSLVLMICAPVVSPILTFGVYAGLAQNGGDTLTIVRAFTAQSLLVLVNKPLTDIVLAVPILAGEMASFQRIQNFLNGKERRDNRQIEGCQLWDDKNKEGGTVTEEDGVVSKQSALEPLPMDIIAAVEGKFSWQEGSEPVIDISGWKIKRKAFTLVLGPVGCGKSTLLRTLLGEVTAFEGTIRVAFSGIAYCGQSAWLPNETVRNIITGGGSEAVDEAWYDTVVNACALKPDIQTWPKGDATMAGSMGISMSGGQKHRIAIARALYLRTEFLIFDDVFSGLDAATDDLIFNNLFGKQGLLQTGNMTIVLASSDTKRVPFADAVVVLSEKGKLQEGSGKATTEDLTTVFSAASTTRSRSRKDADADADAGETRKDREHHPPPQPAALNSTVARALGGVDHNDPSRRLGDSSMYLFWARAAGWGTVVGFMCGMAAFAFFTSFPSIWLKWWSEANITRPNQDLGKWIGVYTAFGIGAIISVLFGSWQLFVTIINNSGVYFHDMLIKAVSRAPMSFHSSVDTGVTVNRFSQDLQLIDMELPGTALGTAVSFCIGFAEFIIIAVSSRYLAAVLPLLFLAFYLIQHFYLRTSRQMRLMDIEYKAPLYTQLIETLDGLETIRAFGWSARFQAKNMSLLDDSQRPNYLLYSLQRWLTFAVDMVVTGVAVVLVVITTTLREQVGPGYMGIALSTILGFSVTVKGVVTSWVMLEVALGAVSRVKTFTTRTKAEDEDVDERGEGGEEKADQDGAGAALDGVQAWPSEGAIELKGVSASYPSTGVVLDSISLSIEAGQRVAICGRTGSGKSSMLLTLLRMIDDVSGAITIDGVDISTLPHERVRSSLVAVPQETYIFDGTVRVNVDPGKVAADNDDTDLEKALKAVRLWGRVQQRGGLDAVIDDRFFSHGEKQLLVFARAMMRKGKVLILDEATSSLDDETSTIINEVLRTWFAGWTVIAIAHKLDSILDFDRVAVLDKGKLVEYGEPRLLLEREGSAFKALYGAGLASASAGGAE